MDSKNLSKGRFAATASGRPGDGRCTAATLPRDRSAQRKNRRTDPAISPGATGSGKSWATPNALPDRTKQIEQLLLQLADEAGDSMQSAGSQIAESDFDRGVASQKKVLDRLNQIFMAIAPFANMLQRATQARSRSCKIQAGTVSRVTQRRRRPSPINQTTTKLANPDSESVAAESENDTAAVTPPSPDPPGGRLSGTCLAAITDHRLEPHAKPEGRRRTQEARNAASRRRHRRRKTLRIPNRGIRQIPQAHHLRLPTRLLSSKR